MPSIILQSPVPERTADQFSGYRYACYPAYVSRKNGYDHNDQGKEIEEFILMEQHDKTIQIKRLILHTPSANAKANLQVSGKCEVLQGSTMKVYAAKEMVKMKTVFEQLVEKKVLVVEADGKAKFAKSHLFKSANEAACFLLRRGGENSTAWRSTELKKPETKKAAAKPAPKKPEKKADKKPVHKNKPAKAQTAQTEKKASAYPKKPAVHGKGNGSKRKDPRNPRGIRPQGNEAVKAAQSVPTPGYIRFAGMGQGVKIKH